LLRTVVDASVLISDFTTSTFATQSISSHSARSHDERIARLDPCSRTPIHSGGVWDRPQQHRGRFSDAKASLEYVELVILEEHHCVRIG